MDKSGMMNEDLQAKRKKVDDGAEVAVDFFNRNI
jgi:hypothetical protein